MLEAGGTIEDVRLACRCTGSMEAAWPALLLFKQTKCVQLPRQQQDRQQLSISMCAQRTQGHLSSPE